MAAGFFTCYTWDSVYNSVFDFQVTPSTFTNNLLFQIEAKEKKIREERELMLRKLKRDREEKKRISDQVE